MSIICCAAGRFGSIFLPLTGSSASPKMHGRGVRERQHEGDEVDGRRLLILLCVVRHISHHCSARVHRNSNGSMAHARHRRQPIRPTARDHAHAARAGRLPVGPRADARLAAPVRARRDLRGARGDRERHARASSRRARRLPLRGGLPRPDQRGGRRLLHRRRHRRHLRQARSPASARLRAAGRRRRDHDVAGDRALGNDEGARARRGRAGPRGRARRRR